MRLPGFLCIGAQKSATKWFYEMLRQHPKVWMSPLKELHYFDRFMDDSRETRWRHNMLAEKNRTSPPWTCSRWRRRSAPITAASTTKA